VAKLLFKPLNGLTKDQILKVRVKLIDNLIRLYKKQETPHQYKTPKKRGRPKVCRLYSSTDIDDEEENISQGETEVESNIDWETKTLADEDSDTDSIAPIEVMRLCKKQETPHQYKAPKKRGRPKGCRIYSSTDIDDEEEDISQGETEVESDID
jgi:hypothetical protein